jgi:hypothetical protein
MTDQADQAGGTTWADEPGSPGPNVARIYDYLLGGKDHFAVDREAAQRPIAVLPDAPAAARANRAFLAAAVRHAGPVPREPVQDAYGSRVTLTGRPAAEIAAYFDGFDLVPPGLVPVAEWPAAQPGTPPPQPAQAISPQAAMLAGVGRKVFTPRG